MSSLASELVPLALASMLVPVQWTLTVLLVRTSVVRALVFLSGNLVLRLLQGVLFFALVSDIDGRTDQPRVFLPWLLLVAGVLLLVKGVRSLLSDAPDDDAPPPRWVESATTLSLPRSFLLGAGLLAIGAKFWVFTMSAVIALDAAGLSGPSAAGWFVAFAVAALLPSLAIVLLRLLAPSRSAAVLDAVSAWLMRNTRRIVVGICLVVGTWFVIEALSQLGVL